MPRATAIVALSFAAIVACSQAAPAAVLSTPAVSAAVRAAPAAVPPIVTPSPPPSPFVPAAQPRAVRIVPGAPTAADRVSVEFTGAPPEGQLLCRYTIEGVTEQLQPAVVGGLGEGVCVGFSARGLEGRNVTFVVLLPDGTEFGRAATRIAGVVAAQTVAPVVAATPTSYFPPGAGPGVTPRSGPVGTTFIFCFTGLPANASPVQTTTYLRGRTLGTHPEGTTYADGSYCVQLLTGEQNRLTETGTYTMTATVAGASKSLDVDVR